MQIIAQGAGLDKVRKALEERYPEHDFQWRGRAGLCPEHPDTHPSLYLYPDGAYCFGCGRYFPLEGTKTGKREAALWKALADYLRENLAADTPAAQAAREWLQELCGLDPQWLIKGAPVGEAGRIVRLPVGFIADPRGLWETGRQLARELGIDLEHEQGQELSKRLARVADAAFKAWRRKEGKSVIGVVAFVYESTPGRVETFKFRPLYGTSRQSRFPGGKVGGAFGLGLVEPRLLEQHPVVVVEGETDLLAIQAAALREGCVFPVIAAGGKGRFAVVAQLLHKLEPKAKIYVWPDSDVDAEKVIAGYHALIWPYSEEQIEAKADPRDLVLGKSSEEVSRLVSSSVLTLEELKKRQRLKKAQEMLDTVGIVTAPELLARDFPAVKWIVPELIPEGLTLLCGKPKIGKSWLCLELALAVASGGYALGKLAVERRGVLYLALEDSDRRLQRRLQSLLAEQDEWTVPAPSGLYLNTVWPRLDRGGLEMLEAFLLQHPEVRLVLIDTLAKIRPRQARRREDLGLYDQDYRALEGLQQLAGERGVSVVVVHHLRKSGADDPLDLVSGTTGLTGGADTIMILTRSRGEADGELFVTGRDVEERSLALKREITGSWTLLGDADEYRQSKERREILEILREAGEPLSPKEIAEMLGANPNTIRVLLLRMLRDGQVRRLSRGVYAPASSTSVPTQTVNNVNNVNTVNTVNSVNKGPNDSPNAP